MLLLHLYAHIGFFLEEDLCFAAHSAPNIFILLLHRKVCFFVQKDPLQTIKSVSIWPLYQPFPLGWPLLSFP